MSFIDSYTLEQATTRDSRQFVYDQVFGPASTQAEVFEDTERLVQSAVDGYNVCIFAYGQTGSGKTFTMTGSSDMPGIIPRSVSRLFDIAAEVRRSLTIRVETYMVSRQAQACHGSRPHPTLRLTD